MSEETAAINESSLESSLPQSGGKNVFAIPQFRWLFLGNLAFFFAMQGQMLTRSLLAWELTGRATALAYINLVVAVPLIFASILGGAITDRVERRQLVVAGQCLIAANELFLLIMLLTDQLQFWHLLCTAFLTGCALPFIMPARIAITMQVVGPKLLQSAMAFQSGGMNLNRVLGPAIMGLIVGSISFEAAFALATLLYVCAILCMFQIERSRSAPKGTKHKALTADIGDGFRYLFSNRSVLTCLAFGLLPMFMAMPFQNLLVVLAEEAWGAGESAVGLLMATGGIGGVAGSIWVIRRGDNAGRLSMMVGCTLAFAVFLALFSKTPSLVVALLPLLLANVCMNASQTVNNATIQLLIEDDMRGRMSSLMMLSFGLTPIGVFPMAIAADHIGAANAILGAATLLIVLTLLFYWASPTLRGLDAKVNETLAERNKTDL